MADRVAVMYGGRIVEQAPAGRLFGQPAHPYTRGLLASIPGGAAGKRLNAIPGNVPALGQFEAGCPFGPRCADRFDACGELPELTTAAEGHQVRCFLNDGANGPTGQGRR
jgi:oligopeptide/dipeptide ABC transporter ATP-binding protein